MSSDIDKLAEKTANLSIDPVYDTNWCDMPAEIKLECIGKMKFKERNPNNGGEFLKYIWKIGVFKTFLIGSCFPTAKETFLNYTGMISADNIHIGSCDNEMVVDVLKKLTDGVKSITMYCAEGFDYNFDEILEISQVQNSKNWFIEKYHQTDILAKFAQMWIDKNSKIGSTLSFSVKIDRAFDEFSENFADRIVTIREKKVRIRTNNSDRHILLDRGTNERLGRWLKLKFYRLSVISADMIESEF
ncbi:hypothetical protein B9Z55_012780 [Caenorhabditis nigoni]|uniref:F-box associated domain-containing protein n=1 Tax=Caenorhabditis nigoni TaxID=1611254 RepID=A0A2G5TYR5_9PELO|nr:hypothetical protein B9Z55_012780 [Caenorhabditis nigoni]